MQLDPSAIDAGARLVALDTVDSTNKEALAHARRGAGGPLWVTAAAQTQGRGRGGRSWISHPGNLYASLLLCDPAPFERAPELAFVAALAVRDAIVSEAPMLARDLALKWPNDLLLSGEKCVGILIEGEAEVEPVNRVIVVIGIGVNCAHHPTSTSDGSSHDGTVLFPATDLRAHGADVTPEQLFMRLSATMRRRIAQWSCGQGFASIVGDWISASRGIGEQICVRNGASEKAGRFVGLDQSGRLLLERVDGGLEKISAGDVFPFAIRGGRQMPGWQAE